MAPSKMKAIVTTGDGSLELTEVSVPSPGPGEMLVRVIAACQNPTDWKSVKYFRMKGNVVGCDFAGVVEELGPDAPAHLKVGDRVASVVHGSASSNGAFAEYVVALSSFAIHLPESWTFAEGAQLGIAGFTACLCLYHVLGLPTPSLEDLQVGGENDAATIVDFDKKKAPTGERPDVLIWGGATSVGQFAIQLARLSQLPVFTTCSPHNAAYVRSLGASSVLDYHTKSTPADIRALTHDSLKYAVDCVSEGETRSQIYDALESDSGEKKNGILPMVAHIMTYKSEGEDKNVAKLRKDVENKWALGYRLFGKPTTIPFKVPADPLHYQFATSVIIPLFNSLLALGKGTGAENDLRLRPNPIKVMPHGLLGVKDGFEYMMSGKVSAEKITYIIADTPGL